MVDDEPPERGRGSWTGQHRSSTGRGGRSAARRPRQAAAPDGNENRPPARAKRRPEKAVGAAAIPDGDAPAPAVPSADAPAPTVPSADAPAPTVPSADAPAPAEPDADPPARPVADTPASGVASADAAPPAEPDADRRARPVADAPRPRRVAGAARIPDQPPVGIADHGDDEGDHAWLDRDAGPVVRPYTLTGGRSRPFSSGLGLLTHVEALYAPEADLVSLQPEHREILSLTRTALSVAELAGRLDLPVGVVRVLVGDLLQANLVSTFEADAAVRPPSDDILQAVINGLRAL